MHFHIRCSESFFHSYHTPNLAERNSNDHFARLARYLTGKNIGFALGGGGARGFSHVGVLKDMQESGMPIDFISGTSMGAFIGGLWAFFENFEEVDKLAKQWSDYTKSYLFWFFDLTFPIVSLFTGRQFSYILKDIFGTLNLEDAWTPLIIISTDLTEERSRIHNFGLAYTYIQASMSIIGYLPPVSDPYDEHLLADGGYADLVPVNDLVRLGCKHVFGVVVSTNNIGLYKGNFGNYFSASYVLLNKLNPFKKYTIPSCLDLQFHLGFICSSNVMQNIQRTNSKIIFLKPNVTKKYSNSSFQFYEDIKKLGIECSEEYLKSLKCIDCFTGLQKCQKCHNQSLESYNQSFLVE